jgi:hypothetical protein
MSRWSAMIAVLLTLSAAVAQTPRGIHPIINLAVDADYCGSTDTREECSYLFGGLRYGKYVNGDSLQPKMTGRERDRLYSTDKFLGIGTGSKPEIDELGHATPSLTVALPAGITPEQTVIGIYGGWNALPRVPKKLDTTNQVYVQLVRDLLIRKGITDPKVSITQLWRVDLEGDGKEEVIIAATTPRQAYRDCSPEVEAGDYSLVLLRKLVKGKVETIAIRLKYFPATPAYSGNEDLFDLTGVFDVDGDGTMEIITSWRYHEGFGQAIHRIRGATVHDLSTAGVSI